MALRHVRGPAFPPGVQLGQRIERRYARAERVVRAREQFRAPVRDTSPGVEQRDLGLPPVEGGIERRQVADLQGDHDQAGGRGEKDYRGRRRSWWFGEAKREDGRARVGDGGGDTAVG